jgi:hypothetical protein
VAVSSGVGSVGETKLRMNPVADQILGPLNADGLLLTVTRNPNTNRWQVGVQAGTEYSRPLTLQSGAIGAWQWVLQRPTLTRVVVGGAGEGAAREFVTVIDTALEAALGVVLEGFIDAPEAELGDDLTPYGVAALADAAGKAGITATLRDTSWFRFPSAYGLGTKVPMKVGAIEATDFITQIDITHSVEGGLRVVPKLGFAVEDPQARMLRIVSNVATSVRKLERR